MSNGGLMKLVSAVSKTARKHSPEILMGLGITGMITTAVMAVKATPKACEMIEDRHYERYSQLSNEEKEEYLNGYDDWSLDNPVKPAEMIKIAWKCYIPSAIIGLMSIGCLIGSNSVNVRRHAALATAYALSETTLKEYQEKVIETIGEKKEKEVRDAIDKKKVEEHPVSRNEVIITEKGNTLCLDKLSGRYFRSDVDKLKAAVNELNRQMRYDMYVSVNEFYDAIGLSHTEFGDMLGWNIDRDYIDLQFSSQLAEDGTPCLVVGHRVLPQYEFDR